MKKINNFSLWFFILTLITSCNQHNNTADAYGNFEADDLIVSSQSMGQLIDFNITEGQILKEGTTVGYTDTSSQSVQKSTIQAQIKAALSQLSTINAEIKVLETQLQNAQIEQNRIIELFNHQAATQQQLDQVNGQADLLREKIKATGSRKNGVMAEVEVLRTRIDQTNEAIQKCLIINPVQGVVLQKYTMKGEMISIGKPLYKIANLDQLILKAYVSGSQLPGVQIGQKVKVMIDQDEHNNQTFEGKVIWISSEAEFTPKIIQTKEERVNLVYAIKVLVNNDGSIKIGMPGEIQF